MAHAVFGPNYRRILSPLAEAFGRMSGLDADSQEARIKSVILREPRKSVEWLVTKKEVKDDPRDEAVDVRYTAGILRGAYEDWQGICGSSADADLLLAKAEELEQAADEIVAMYEYSLSV